MAQNKQVGNQFPFKEFTANSSAEMDGGHQK